MFIVFCLIIWAILAKLFERPKNYYIEKHKVKFSNDTHYQLYEMWCYKNGEIPMSKEVVLPDVEAKEKYIKNQL